MTPLKVEAGLRSYGWWIALLQEYTIVRAIVTLEARLGVAAVGGGASSLPASRELGRC